MSKPKTGEVPDELQEAYEDLTDEWKPWTELIGYPGQYDRLVELGLAQRREKTLMDATEYRLFQRATMHSGNL